MPEPRQVDSLNPAPLDGRRVGTRVLIFPDVTSTNERALAIGGDGTVVVAERQTAGRGRHGRSWVSAPGLGLWFSVVFERQIPGLQFAGPLAVREAVRAVFPQSGQILAAKWPNDLLLRGKKFCGALVESRGGRYVLGLGINVRHRPEDFPPELRDRATSLDYELAGRTDRSRLLRSVLGILDRRVVRLTEIEDAVENTCREWLEACRLFGRRVSWRGGEGIIERVDPLGVLYVQARDGLAAIPFEESSKLVITHTDDAA